jgi:hypothetical protein
METSTFNLLKQNITRHTANDLETVGFVAKSSIYEMGFYMTVGNNYKVIVEDFGKMLNGKWIQDEPTSEQVQELQDYANDKLIQMLEVQNQLENEKYEDDTPFDLYYYNGVRQSDFY